MAYEPAEGSRPADSAPGNLARVSGSISRARRRGTAPSRVVVAVLGLALVVWLVVANTRPNGRTVHAFDRGPLQMGSVTGTSMAAELGQTFTYGGIVLDNTADRPAVVEDVRAIPTFTSGMEIVGVMVGGRERQIGMIGTDPQFPPPDVAAHLRPYRGAIVPPDRTPGEFGLELFFGLRIDRPGEFGFRGFEIDYRIGKKRYTVRLEDRFLGCAPRGQYPDGCDLEHFRPNDGRGARS